MNDPEMREIFDGYVIETEEILENLTQDLMELEGNPGDSELLNKIFRGFHTIKGNSSFIGLDDISELTHSAEDLLNKLRRFEIRYEDEMTDILLEVRDAIQNYLGKLQEGEEDSSEFESIIARLVQIKSLESDTNAEESENTGDSEEISDDSDEQITAEAQESGDSALEKVLSDNELIAKEGDFSESEEEMLQKAFEEVNKSFQNEVSSEKDDGGIEEAKTEIETIEKEETTKKNEDKLAEKNGKPKEQKSQGKRQTTESIRIDLKRVETLMDLSGELVLGRNRLTQISDNLDKEFKNTSGINELLETAESIDFITSEIQTAVMRMRMVPVKQLFIKAPRITRDLSKEFGKSIKLEMKGEETEIDRGIIEELNDPMVHMIRNSCDHGIEKPEVRREKGKPEQGTLTLEADNEGNNIVIRISDDGAGMDPEKLKSIAFEKGVISKEQADQMTDREAFQLIFKPGFSSAKQVSSVSGRGVGMDVVRTNIQNLNGMVQVDSKAEEGSTFTIKLPLTLASIQGLLVKVRNNTFAIPLSSVVEVVSIDDYDISRINQEEVIRIREEIYPLLRLQQVLEINHNHIGNKDKYIVVVGIGIKRVGLVVDELIGQEEIVIKSLGDYLGNVRGIAGSTILGDGSVIMILDVAELIHKMD